MTSMFWGLRMEPGKRYSTTVGRSFHVSMAALDCSSVKQDNEMHSVMLEEGESKVPFILCNLQKQKVVQCPLDLNFMTGDRVTFFCLGNGVIHLSGYVHDDPEDDDLNLLGEEEEEEEEDEDETEEAEEESTSPKGKKKKENGLPLKRKQLEALMKKAKMSKLDEGVDEESDDDEDEDDVMKMDGTSSDDEAVAEAGEEEEDEEDESDDDEDEEQVEEEEEETVPKKLKQKVKALEAKLQKNAQKANGLGPTASVQPSKKEKTKSESGTLQSQKEAQNQKASGTPGKKTIEGGVQIKDIKVGTGKVCTPGKKASVYYIGRFRENNKVFDSARKGNGFTFSVGKGQVIKGWDVGVVGMKVGGKRTIVCPPNMAYGQKGSPPTIPGNSTLVFEVELKNVN